MPPVARGMLPTSGGDNLRVACADRRPRRPPSWRCRSSSQARLKMEFLLRWCSHQHQIPAPLHRLCCPSRAAMESSGPSTTASSWQPVTFKLQDDEARRKNQAGAMAVTGDVTQEKVYQQGRHDGGGLGQGAETVHYIPRRIRTSRARRSRL